MAFCWSSIIWAQALQHNNLQVRLQVTHTPNGSGAGLWDLC
jgi:hypothetical protein